MIFYLYFINDVFFIININILLRVLCLYIEFIILLCNYHIVKISYHEFIVLLCN